MRLFKGMVLDKHLESFDGLVLPHEVSIKQVPRLKNWFFVYWEDGQIARRDTYMIIDGQVYLVRMEKRYEYGGRWIDER